MPEDSEFVPGTKTQVFSTSIDACPPNTLLKNGLPKQALQNTGEVLQYYLCRNLQIQ